MKYRTKAGVNPQGKFKIYFTSHRMDLPLLDTVCSNIWKHRDAVVYYNEETEKPVNQSDLLLMQLMVIPVTTKLLEDSECSAYKELSFFQENKLPVLPLMMERGLDSLYAQKFHNIQYLSMISTDATELTFDERLSYTLDVLLPNEETAEKVRSAFAAYIFLSYRKKDRKKAQELMQMIHRIPEYRDVAIWYDEFIVGSEDFNDSIAAALKKSDLFALMITPNLISEKNYVKEIEYPMALEQNKEILPIETSDTNREELCLQFEKISDVIKMTDEKFEAYMREAYLKMAFVRKEGYPEHDYLIGLAYLNGIDVEMNCILAEQLIREAADAGVVEAMGELVHMLYYGKGITCNREEAICEQKKKIDFLTKRNETKTLIKELDYLGKMYTEMRKLEEAERVYEELRKLADAEIEKAEAEIEINELTLIIADSWLKTGKIRAFMCNTRKSLSAYQGAADTIALLIGNKQPLLADYAGDKEKAALILHTSAIKCGDMLMRIRDTKTALMNYKEAEKIAEILIGINDNEENRRRICKSIVKVAICDIDTGNYSDAESKAKSGLEMAKRLFYEVGSAEDGHIYKLFNDCLGKYYKTIESWEEAATYYGESYHICQKQLEKEKTIEAKLDALDACIQMGLLAHEINAYSVARDYYKEGFGICASLSRKTDEPDYWYGIIQISLYYGDLLMTLGGKKGALPQYANGLEKIESLFFRSKNLDLLYMATEYYRKQALLEYNNESLKDACKQYWKGVFLTASFAKEGDDNSEKLYKQYEEEIAVLEQDMKVRDCSGYTSRCEELISRYAADGEGKRTMYGGKYLPSQEAVSIQAIGYGGDLFRLIYICKMKLQKNKQDKEAVSICVKAYTRLAELEANFLLEKAAEKDYEKAIALAESNLSLEVLPGFILACEKAIQFKKRVNELEELDKYFDRIEKAAERIALETGSQEAYLALANWYAKKGNTEKENDNKQKYYQRAFEIASNIWGQIQSNSQSPLLKQWYDLLAQFERENESIELIFGKDNRRANQMLLQWIGTMDMSEKEKLSIDLDRYLLQDNTGNALVRICEGLRMLYEQNGNKEASKNVAKMKEDVEMVLQRESEYFGSWMKLVQAKHLWDHIKL